jgi:Type I phosphodiesterase / nucleotide pyrophosphatase
VKTLVAAAMALLGASAAMAEKPRLIIAISVDQFSADLFEQYRPSFTGGLRTLSGGTSFVNGYQSHAATETCPGHATILSGIRPGRAGIVANDWLGTRGVKPAVETHRDEIYCVEDETNKTSTLRRPVVSLQHLSPDFVTLGDRAKAKWGAKSRVFAIAGKDRAATLMAGRKADQTFWYDYYQSAFVTYIPHVPAYGNVAKEPLKVIGKVNADVAAFLKSPPPAVPLTTRCAALVKPLLISGNETIGAGPIIPNSDPSFFRVLSALDAKTLEIAKVMISENGLGGKGHTDVLAISLSVTDYVGHSYGPGGPEMCAQMEALDASLGDFLEAVEKTGNPFTVVLTADHGGIDVPERSAAATGRSPLGFALPSLNQALRAFLKEADKDAQFVTAKGASGDLWLTDKVPPEKRAAALGFLKGAIGGLDGVEAVFTRDEIMAAPPPPRSPAEWSLVQRVHASYQDGRSGDLYVILEKGLNPIPIGGKGYVATHGSAWDYDRRVPILFWSKGNKTVAPSDAVETVDILPTLASVIGLKVPRDSVDGRCLELGQSRRNVCGK